MNIKKILYIVLGTIGLILGAIGAVLPLLPAFPFLLLATVCYAKSSERLHNWFINTKLYKNNLESYVQGNGMSWQVKFRVMGMITIVMSIGFIMMALKEITYGCIILFIVWIFHILYFSFRVKTS
ncbi:YbaN family protein [Faecalitalea cylindroides]|uniref:YbaN family protein n=1 Tax=Faecalitalea cylindroides TaxID=39483 RepID=UPI00242BE12C|nr:YbaN family protein [Faecalitalea cylindroides]MEE1448884.1 YbaN family protein [Faecalitalea cylindroides]